MVRVVLDTNVLISAFLKKGSAPAAIMTLAEEGDISLCVSKVIMEEYEGVLQRDKFRSFGERAAEADFLRDRAQARTSSAGCARAALLSISPSLRTAQPGYRYIRGRTVSCKGQHPRSRQGRKKVSVSVRKTASSV